MPDGNASADLSRISSALAALDVSLSQLTGTADQEFLGIGDALGRAVGVFGRLAGNFADLAGQLHSHDAGSAAAALERAILGIQQISVGEQNRTGTLLVELDAGAAEVEKHLGQLARIIGEVGALAINGKIQAALVTTAGVDFSVFTTEIGRLGQLAESSTKEAAGRITLVRSAVASALEAASSFERNEAKELETIRSRIETSLALLAERRRDAAAAADAVVARSQQISQRVANTVGELQINDNVSQRLDHIRTALRATEALASSTPMTEPGCEALSDIPDSRRIAVIGGICRLLSAQLGGGSADYHGEVEGLIRNLSALAADAAGIQAEAETTFGGVGGGLFITEIERDVRRATELLATYGAGRDRTRLVVKAVSESFRAMAGDLAAIRSIDADMRIMGLNATLKCGRLGNEGRALGVVSHELRASSKRTEDCTHGIAALLENALALSEALAAAAADDKDHEAALPMEVMAGSLAALSHLGESMSNALAELRHETSGVSSALSEVAVGIQIHRRFKAIAEDGIVRLTALADTLGGEADVDDAAHEDIVALMAPRYTMDRERLIHQTFAKGHAEVPITTQTPPGGAEAVDDLFF